MAAHLGRNGLKQRTQMGNLLFGGGDDDGGGARGGAAGGVRAGAVAMVEAVRQMPAAGAMKMYQAPAVNKQAPGLDGIMPAARDDKLEQILESNLAFPKPLPWHVGGPPAAAAAVAAPVDVPRGRDWDAEPSSAAVAGRVASLERQVEVQLRQQEQFQRIAADVRFAREGGEARGRVVDDRLAQMERALEGMRREEAAAKEQLRSLQADFRDFAVNAVARQRSEIEMEVAQALGRQRASAEEWQAALRQRDAQLQSEVSRLGNVLENVTAQLASHRGELTSRLGAVEATVMSGHGGSAVGTASRGADAGVSGLGEHFRQQLEGLRSIASQANARAAELQAKLDGETTARNALQRDHEARIAALNHALAAERAQISESLQQRLEVLEAKRDVERNDLLARHTELKQEVVLGDQSGNASVQDLSSRLRGELEISERRMMGELATVRERMEQQIAQLQVGRAAEEEARKASTQSLFKRVEGAAERQLESLRALRQEVDAGLKGASEAVRAENAGRAEAERRIMTEAAETSRSIATEVGLLKAQLHQHAEVTMLEVEQLKRTGAERADSLSRYVDSVVQQAISQTVAEAAGAAGGDNSKVILEVTQRCAALRAAVEEKAQQAERRLEGLAEDLRTRLVRGEDTFRIEVVSAKRDVERNADAMEKRMTTAQEELRDRFEAYVKHFDSVIASVQRAILAPPPARRAGETSPNGRYMDDTDDDLSYEDYMPKVVLNKPTPRSHLEAPPLLPPSTSSLLEGSGRQQAFRTVIEGLRVRAEPDMAAAVRRILPRGEIVVGKRVMVVDGRQWLQLDAGGGDASSLTAGFVLASTDSGKPLLELVGGISAPAASSRPVVGIAPAVVPSAATAAGADQEQQSLASPSALGGLSTPAAIDDLDHRASATSVAAAVVASAMRTGAAEAADSAGADAVAAAMARDCLACGGTGCGLCLKAAEEAAPAVAPQSAAAPASPLPAEEPVQSKDEEVVQQEGLELDLPDDEPLSLETKPSRAKGSGV
eukprot:TRINITY_DN123374_c0_g1_i1.p1 TRINITY_DN123374_c0_g1~~TRINITY_DN123374_c0_g1_i1.p1  ORF type:complete len:1008 (-),score=308.08 TRINITY_DN123374_c0_g1_i1:165-3188(-)